MRSSILKSFILSLVLSSLVACSGGSDSDKNLSGQLTLPDGVSAEQFSQTIKTTCGELNDCNPAVGLFTFITDYANSIGVCTFSLVAEDIILTNAHCIPYGVTDDSTRSCKGKAWIMFPSSGSYERQSFDCERLLNSSTLGSEPLDMFKNPDYAFFKVSKKVKRPILTINTEGLKNQETYDIVRMSPKESNGVHYGVIKNTKCTVYENTLLQGLNTTNETPQSPLKFMSDCELVNGNSGSPILNKNGEVVSIVHALGNSSALARLLISLNLNFSSTHLEDLIATTSMSCIAPPSPIQTIGPVATEDTCSNRNPPISTPEIMVKMNEEFNVNHPLADTAGLHWTFTAVTDEFMKNNIALKSSEWSLPTPQCLTGKVELSQILNTLKNNSEVQLPLQQLEMSINSYLQFIPNETYITSEVTGQLSVDASNTNPDELIVSMTVYLGEELKPITLTRSLELCK